MGWYRIIIQGLCQRAVWYTKWCSDKTKMCSGKLQFSALRAVINFPNELFFACFFLRADVHKFSAFSAVLNVSLKQSLVQTWFVWLNHSYYQADSFRVLRETLSPRRCQILSIWINYYHIFLVGMPNRWQHQTYQALQHAGLRPLLWLQRNLIWQGITIKPQLEGKSYTPPTPLLHPTPPPHTHTHTHRECSVVNTAFFFYVFNLTL